MSENSRDFNHQTNPSIQGASHRMETILSGRLEDCFRHFMKSKWNSDPRDAIASFVGVSRDNTVRRWFSGKVSLKGESAVGVLYFLSQLGYKVTEFERLDNIIKRLMAMVVFKLATIDELATRLDYDGSDMKNRPLLNVFLRGSAMKTERMLKAQKIIEDHAAEIDAKQKEFDRTKLILIDSAAVQVSVLEQLVHRPDRMFARRVAAVPVQKTVQKRSVLSDDDDSNSVGTVAAIHARALARQIRDLLEAGPDQRARFLSRAGDVELLATQLLLLKEFDA